MKKHSRHGLLKEHRPLLCIYDPVWLFENKVPSCKISCLNSHMVGFSKHFSSILFILVVPEFSTKDNFFSLWFHIASDSISLSLRKKSASHPKNNSLNCAHDRTVRNRITSPLSYHFLSFYKDCHTNNISPYPYGYVCYQKNSSYN